MVLTKTSCRRLLLFVAKVFMLTCFVDNVQLFFIIVFQFLRVTNVSAHFTANPIVSLEKYRASPENSSET